MSNIVQKVDQKAAALISKAEDDRGRSGSSLLAPEDLEEDLAQILKWMRGPRHLDVDGYGAVSVPRFGLLSLILQQTPIYVYGHPALKKLSKTAFTDGTHIFISDDLFDKCNDNVHANPSTFGVEWVILHEVMHKLFNHTRRLRTFPHNIANMATDLSINTKLVEGFPDMKPCPMLKETGLGFKTGDKDRWIHLSEETIALELMAQLGLNKKRKVENPPQQGQQQQQKGDPQGGKDQGNQQGGQGSKGQQPSSGGKGQKPGKGQGNQQENDDPLSNLDDNPGGQGQDSQQGSQGDGDPSQGGGRGGKQPQGGKPQKGQGDHQGQDDGEGSGGQDENEGEGGPDGDEPSENFGEDGDNHFVSPADLIKVLEENGMDAVKEKLELPDSDDVEAIGEMEEATRLKQTEAIMAAQADMAKYGGKYPGAHIVEAAGEMVKDFGKAKITWRMALQEMVMGYSPRSLPSMEEPCDLLYVAGMEDVLGMQPYLPSALPHKSEDAVLFLVDTSGSMSNTAMKVAVTEALELKTAASNMGDAASTVFIWPCDTVLRGQPIEITDSNVEEYFSGGVEMKGRGGTSIDTCINQAMNHPLLVDRHIKAIVYCSDLYDSPVPRPSSLEERPDLRTLFLSDPETPPSVMEAFAKGTDWADVYAIDEGLEIDFEEVNAGKQAVSPVTRKRKMR